MVVRSRIEPKKPLDGLPFYPLSTLQDARIERCIALTNILEKNMKIKKSDTALIIVKVLIVLSSMANPAISAEVNSSQNSALNVESFAGLYWSDHKIDFVPFTKKDEVTVSDVLEIVPYDEQAAYVRTRLYFANGHTCSLYGVAKQEGDKLSYYDTRSGRNCILDIVPSAKGITLIDRTEECRRTTCGARGGYGAVFSTSKKRPIRYLDKLKGSPQYQEAVEMYKTRLEAEKLGIPPEWSNAKNILEKYAFWGNVGGVKESLAQGADPNVIKGKGYSPLTASAYSRNIEVTKLLIDHGLDINALQNGETLLTYAAKPKAGHSSKESKEKTYQYIKWLLENGADAKIPNGKGQTALDVAIQTQAPQNVIDLLME